MRQPVLLVICLASLIICGNADYDDGTVKSSLTYAPAARTSGTEEGKALLTVETAKLTKGRPIVSLTVVLDISNSMSKTSTVEGEKRSRLDYVKLASKYVVDRLAVQEEKHTYGSVAFSTDAHELTPLQEITEASAVGAKKAIDDIEAAGDTNLLDGVLRGLKQQADANPDRIRALLVFTDGKPTHGVIRSSMILEAVKNAREKSGNDILIHVVAMGEIDAGFLKELAKIGSGNFYRVVRETDIPKAFAAVLGGLLTEAALEIEYKIEATGDLEILDVQSRGADIELRDRNAVCHVSDLMNDERRAFVIKYRRKRPLKSLDGLQVYGRYRDAVDSKDVSISIGKTYPEHGAEKATQNSKPGLPDVWDLRYRMADMIASPAEDLAAGDVESALSKIDDAVVGIVASDAYSDAYIAQVVDDLNKLKDALEKKDITGETGRAMLDGLSNIVGGDRPTTVDPNASEIVRDGLTATQENLMQEVEDYDKGKALKKLFGIPFVTAVRSENHLDATEYKIQVSVGPPPVAEARPLSLTVVLDKNGNSTGTNATFKAMTDVLNAIVKDLKSDPKRDVKLGIVLSSGSAKTILKLTKIDDIDVGQVAADIDAFNPDGDSAIADALEKAIRQQAQDSDRTGSQSVFLITDGHPTKAEEVLSRALKELAFSPQNVHLHTFGIEGCDGALLKDIAKEGNGDYYDLDDLADLGPSVATALWRLAHIKAHEVIITLKPVDEGVVIQNCLPDTTDRNGTRKTAFAKVYAEEIHDILATVKAPKEAKTLLEMSISYVDVFTGQKLTSDDINIRANDEGSMTRRELDEKLLDKLEPAIETGVTRKGLSAMLDAVYDAIPVVEAAVGVDADYKDELLEDLQTIARKTAMAEEGTSDDLHDADCTMQTFVDTIKEQCVKGAGLADLRVQGRYQPYGLREKQRQFLPTGKKEVVVESAPATIRYKDPIKELTTEEQELKVTFEIEAQKISDEDLSPAFIIFLVDTSEGTKPEDVEKVKTKVFERWSIYKDLAPSSTYFELLVYGDGVYPLLGESPISILDNETVSDVFDFVMIGGESSFRDGFLEAFDIAKFFVMEKQTHDIEIIAFVGSSAHDADKDSDAEMFIDKADELGFRLTFTPVLMENADAHYFDVYPEWVRLNLLPSVDKYGAEELPPKIAGRRLRLIPDEAQGIDILDVDDGLKGDNGYSLPDMLSEEKRTVDVKLKVPEGDAALILRLPRLTMYDPKTKTQRTVLGQSLSIPRRSEEEAEDLKNLRTTIRDAATKIDEAIDEKNWPFALESASRTIGFIDESNVENDDVSLVKTRLTYLAKDIYNIIADEKSADGAKLLIKSILDGIKETETAEPTVDKDAMWPGWKEGPGYSKEEPDLLEVIFDDSLRMKSTDTKTVVPLTIRAPRHRGDIVDAQAIILLDNSANADWKNERRLAMILLNGLAKRQGKRAVSLWTWGYETTEIYSKKDFRPEDLDDAVAGIDSVALGGLPDPMNALRLIQSIAPVEKTITVVYWLVTTQLPVVAQLGKCVERLGKPSAPMVIAFKPDVMTDDFDVLDRVTEASGGKTYSPFPWKSKMSDTEVNRGIQDAGWQAVDRIEKTYSKDVTIKIQGYPPASDIAIETQTPVKRLADGRLLIPSMDYGTDVNIKVAVDFDDRRIKRGIHDLLTVQGTVTSLRSQKTKPIDESKIPIEILKPKDAVKIDTLYTMLDSAGWDLFYFLGRNRPKKALITAEEMKMQPKMARLEYRADMQVLASTYDAIVKSIKNYINDKNDIDSIQNVSHLVDDMDDNFLPHYSDRGGFLSIKSFPASMTSKPGVFRSRLTIETPSWEKPLPWKFNEHTAKVVSVAVIFDTANHDTLIDREVKPLPLQKIIVERLAKQLVALDYKIDLQALSSADGGITSLKTKRLDSSNIDEISAHLDQIRQKGKPTNLLSSLASGLPFIQSVVDSERLVLLFKDASSVGTVETAACKKALSPYIAYPINPVKVMTYIIGKREDPIPDPISDLTGGERMWISKVGDVLEAVPRSVACFDRHAARSIRVDVRLMDPYVNGLKVVVDGERRPLDIVGDMKHSAIQSIDLQLQLPEALGDEDVFEYSVSYYRPKYKRWFKTPTKTFRARRARDEVIQEQTQIRKEILPLLNRALNQLTKRDYQEAASSVHEASEIAHGAVYQDDSLVREMFDYLARVYDAILVVSEDRKADTSHVQGALKSEGCALGLNVGGQCGHLSADVSYPEKRFTPSFFPVS